jgi:hypothetical protein
VSPGDTDLAATELEWADRSSGAEEPDPPADV